MFTPINATVPTSTIAEIMAFCVPVLSREDAHPALQNIYIDCTTNPATACGCDGFRMASVCAEGMATDSDVAGFMIPAVTVPKSYDCKAETRLTVNENSVTYDFGFSSVTVPCFQCQYVDYKNVLYRHDENREHKIYLNANYLVDMLQSFIKQDKAKGNKGKNQVPTIVQFDFYGESKPMLMSIRPRVKKLQREKVTAVSMLLPCVFNDDDEKTGLTRFKANQK